MGSFIDRIAARVFGNDTAKEQIAAENKYYANKNKLDESTKVTHNASVDEGINRQQHLKSNYGLSSDPQLDGDTLYYPQELFTPSQPHGVHFFINARQVSVAAEEAVSASGAELKKLQAAQEGYNSEYTAENRAKSELYENASTLTGTLAGALGLAAGTQSGMLGEASKSGLGSLLITAGGAGVGALLGKGVANNTSTIRLLKSIQLHVPASVVAAYAANWSEAETGIAGMIGSGKYDGADLLELPEYLGRGLIAAAANIPKGLGANADFGAVLEATSKKVANPYKEQLFKSMGFRRFAFNYHFAPRNEGEARNCMEIINTFKYHMHPEASDGDMFLIYPAEFSIVFEILDNGSVKRNPYLPKVSSCALTSVKATYGPDGMFNTFQDTDGIPSEMHLELAFTELETLTAVRIAQGF